MPLSPGDRVVMTRAAAKRFVGARTGVVVRLSRESDATVRVKRDGYKSVETYTADFWRKR